MSVFGLAFSAPWVLLALAGAPLLYLLLRVTPPPPARIPFPPLRLILDVKKADATPARTPLWLLVLRMALAGLVVLAMAGPVYSPEGAPAAGGKGPLLLLIDDFWPAAPDWDLRMKAAQSLLAESEREGEPVALLPMSEAARAPALEDSAAAATRLRALAPKAFIGPRAPALKTTAQFLQAHAATRVVWLTDGLRESGGAEFAQKLAALAPKAEILRDPRPIRAVTGADNQSETMVVSLLRSAPGGASKGKVRAFDAKGAPLGDAAFDFGVKRTATARFDLPLQLRNDMARLEIVGEHSAGGVFLLDSGARRRRVGLISGDTTPQPYLSPLHYLRDALSPFADLREPRPGDPDPVGHLLEDGVDVLILADSKVAGRAMRVKLDKFLDSGGTIIRFAGPRLAAGGDKFVPVRLRRGGRTLGGALSWERPKPLAPFDKKSPFFGLKTPAEVTVSRQVLAEPEEGLPEKTWARLADGTPLVTAEKRGHGLLILFHVTADPSWSNLPMSGLFVDMLRRIVDRAAIVGKRAAAGETAKALAPLRTLDGFGRLGEPSPLTKPLPAKPPVAPDAAHPAGFYGEAGSPRAFNAYSAVLRLAPLDFSRVPLKQKEVTAPPPVDLRPPLLIGAFLLALADALALLVLGGRWRRRAGPALALLALAVVLAPPPAKAQHVSQRDMNAALKTELAYVVTGDTRVDRISREGLTTLSQVLAQRTALVPGPPQAIDPAHDELAFYPLIYWPIAPDTPQPGAKVARRIQAYMKQGGLVLFDTRDGQMQVEGGPMTPAQRWLRTFLADIDVPPLQKVPPNHVVYRTFYILENFVGRTMDGPTYIEALPPPKPGENRPARAGDNVSPIIIASNDLAAAWAEDSYGDGLYTLIPGGRRQREMALRGGVNIVMYSLTGNYKADQVHVRELLERLSR